MMKVIEISGEIEQFDENLVHMMKMLGTFQLVDKLKLKRPIWAENDEWYVDRYVYTYEWKVNSGCEELADNLYQMATNNDLLN